MGHHLSVLLRNKIHSLNISPPPMDPMSVLTSLIASSHEARRGLNPPYSSPQMPRCSRRQPEIPKFSTRLSPQKVTWDNYLFIPSPQTLNITENSNGFGSCSVNGATVRAEPGRPSSGEVVFAAGTSSTAGA